MRCRDTSDNDVAADDANQISMYVQPHDHEARTSTSSNVSEMVILHRIPRFREQPQRPKYYRRSNRQMKGVRHFLGKMDVICVHCGAMHFMEERLTKSTLKEPTFGSCCLEGKIKLPNLRVPPEEFKKLLEGTDEEARSFRENIR
ncbi:hypothetical protein MKX03_008059, partial [Papaver bracteatum]